MGKLNVMPRGISSGKSSGQVRHPSCTTSAMHLPIHAKRSSALLCFSCSPIGQLFSRCRLTRDRSLACSPLAVVSLEVSSESSNSMNPTRRFVPPLSRERLSLEEPKDEAGTHMSMARYLQACQSGHTSAYVTTQITLQPPIIQDQKWKYIT